MIRCITVILLGLVLTPFAAPAEEREIFIVKSSDNSYFNQTIETLIDRVDRALRFRILMSEDLEENVADARPDDIFIALGLQAARQAERLAGGKTRINAYLTHEQYLGLEKPARISVLLDQPMHRYLAFCKLLLGSNSVGVIDDDGRSFGERNMRFAEQLGLTLDGYLLDGDNKLLPMLRRLLQRNDPLLMLPRASIYNRDTLKGVLLTSYRFRRPAISYSPAHVDAGALASIYSSPKDIGRHLAILVNRLPSEAPSSGPDFEYARFFSIVTNARVARALNLGLPAESKLRTDLERLEP